MFAVKKLTAAQTMREREMALENSGVRRMYFSEYGSMTGEQNFLNAVQNYPDLKGQQTDLFKCFLPLAWEKNSGNGVSAFVHPEGVYDDPKGGALREKLYPRLRYHFQFANGKKLFSEVHHHTAFSLNVYGSPQMHSFDTISNLYDANSIAECYGGDASAPVPGMKDENGVWNVRGHPDPGVDMGYAAAHGLRAAAGFGGNRCADFHGTGHDSAAAQDHVPDPVPRAAKL